METKNAKITGTMLGVEDHGIFTCMVYLDSGGCSQGFGGWALDAPLRDVGGNFIKREGTAIGMEFIKRILEVLEIEKWESLKGTPCRIRGTSQKISAIGHFLKDQWFAPSELEFS